MTDRGTLVVIRGMFRIHCLSSLHWALLVLFCVFFVQWNLCPKMYLCAKRASKIIVQPKEL